ncbi:MAG: glycosyltransferase family 39 protein [Chloroflexota bacterium]
MLILFVVGTLAHQATLPIMEGFDEDVHYSYITRLRADNRLPDRRTREADGTNQESSQPPFAYWATATLFNILRLPPDNGAILNKLRDSRNLWFTPPDPWHRTDNFNVYFHGGVGEELFAPPEIVTGDRVGRLLSLAFGVLAVIGAYGAAREVFRRESWTLVATAIFAFTPQMLHISAVISNDASAVAFATLTIWQALVVLRHGATSRRLLLIGLLLGLAGLSKVNALLILPGVALALLINWRTRRLPLRQLIATGLLVVLPFVVVFGPWVAYGIVTYQSPLGLETHSAFENPNLPPPTIPQFLGALVPVYMSYWGKLGNGGTWMNPIVYVLFTGLVGLSLLGYATFLFSRRHPRLTPLTVQQALILLIIAMALFAGLMQWLLRLFAIYLAIHGRLMYPAHAAVAILLTGGLYLLDCFLRGRYTQILRLYAVGLPMTAGLLIAPLAIYATYAPPIILTRQQLPALQGTPIDFDHTVRLLGYTQSNPFIHEDSLHTITLCWEILQPTKRIGAYSVKVLDVGDVVAIRTSVLGLGHYDLGIWKPGDIFCDAVDIALDKPLAAGQTYDVLVNLIDWKATTLDGTALDLPRIAQVISPAGDMRSTVNETWQNTTIEFPGFADLEGVAINGSLAAGQTLRLDFLWAVKGQTTNNWSQFIHLVGPQNSVVLADKIPGAGRYPTWAWSSGEKVVDQWQIAVPPDLPPGDYTIQIGFYRQDTGERVLVTQDGKSAPDSAATVFKFKVK